MDDDMRLCRFKGGANGGRGGYVSVVVGDVREAVFGGIEIEDGEGAGVGFMELADDVVTEEATASYDQHVAKGAFG